MKFPAWLHGFMPSMSLLLVAEHSSAQVRYDPKRPSAISIEAFYLVFRDIPEDDQSNAKTAFYRVTPGLAIGYQKGLNAHGDLQVSFSAANAASNTYSNHFRMLTELEGTFLEKLRTDEKPWTPFASLGLAAASHGNNFGLLSCAGAGIQANLRRQIFLGLSAQYQLALAGRVQNHAILTASVTGNIGRFTRIRSKRPLAAFPDNLPAGRFDRDHDGIPDSTDACPLAPGLAQYGGCPDTDGDGIPDPKDACPAAPGSSRYAGCPVPDTDGDGLPDDIDSCTTVAGPAWAKGCPVPENIPQEKASLAARNIFFKTGSAELEERSTPALHLILQILLENRELHLSIEGHTDDVGNDPLNQDLSERRAKSVYQFLVAAGVSSDRLSWRGFGKKRPVERRSTTEAREKNRRVEFILHR